MERFPAHEPPVENREKDPRKAIWRAFKVVTLAGSLLINGGFLAENMSERAQIRHLSAGGKQTFSIDYPKTYEHTAGQRGDFSLQKMPDGRWNLLGVISEYEKLPGGSDTAHPLHEVTYELPPLTDDAAEALFKDIQRAGQPTAPQDIDVFMNHLIETSNKGTISYYDADSHDIAETLELDAWAGTVTSKHFVPGKKDGSGKAVVDEASTYTMTNQQLDQRADFHDRTK